MQFPLFVRQLERMLQKWQKQLERIQELDLSFFKPLSALVEVAFKKIYSI